MVSLEEVEGRHDARTWINAALRGRAAYVTALFAVACAPETQKQNAVGELVVAANTFLNSSVHAVTASALCDPQAMTQADPTLVLLRNVHEHWDEQRATFSESGRQKTQSGKKLAEKTDISPWEFAYNKVPGAGVSLGPLLLSAIDEILARCVAVVRGDDWEPDVQPAVYPPDGLAALNVIGHLIHDRRLGLSLLYPILSTWLDDSTEESPGYGAGRPATEVKGGTAGDAAG